MTAHPQCVIRVTIVGSADNSTGQEFFFNGVAVVPYTNFKPTLAIDKRAVAAFGY